MPEPTRRFLFAYAPVGLSHRRALEAVSTAMAREFPDAQIRTVDVFEYINPAARAVLTKGYSSIVSMAPGLWGYLYGKESLVDSLAPAENFARSVRWDELRGLLAEFPPDVLLTSHAFAAAPFVRLKREGALEVPIVSVLTDYQVHGIELQEGISLYTCADSRLADELAKRGVERELVYPAGIPVAEAFTQPKDRAALRAKFGLDPDPENRVLLVLGEGLEPDITDRLLFQLSLVRAPHQTLVSSGGNAELESRLRRYASMYGVRAKMFGAVDNLHEFLAASDLAVTRGDGLTAAECIASGLPLVILEPTPGQDERNSELLVQRGAARRAAGVLALGAEIDIALGDRAAYDRMKEAIAELHKPNAARDVARAAYLAAENRAEIVRRERERRLAREARPGTDSGAPKPRAALEEIGDEHPAGATPNLSREAAKELLVGWIMSEKDARRRHEEALTEAEKWQRRAEIAARRSEDELAKEALRRAEEWKRELAGLERELARIAAEKGRITGRAGGGPPPATTIGSPDLRGAEMESRFRNMELDEELQKLKRRLDGLE